MYRTHTTKELIPALIGQRVVLAGWLHAKRNHGELIFIDLRDQDGIVQVVCDSAVANETFMIAKEAHPEDVVKIGGLLKMRAVTHGSASVEVLADSLEILNSAKHLPILPHDDPSTPESLRLRYRYLDLRRPRMRRNIHLRYQITKAIRDWLDQHGFWEVETPLLLKCTTGGAREIPVPSRLHPGKFYALAQSPQQLKQLLIIAGVDRCFQMTRNFRDEDPRLQRQIEYTELGLEMAFAEEADVTQLGERLIIDLVQRFAPDRRISQIPFPHLTLAKAMSLYGTDNPDMRFGLEIIDLDQVLPNFPVGVSGLPTTDRPHVAGLCVPGGASLTVEKIRKLDKQARQLGAKGLIWYRIGAEGIVDSNSSALASQDLFERLKSASGAKSGDLVLIAAGAFNVVSRTLGHLRLDLGDQLGLRDPNQLAFAWIEEFPLFKWDDLRHQWRTAHQPFDAPMEADIALLDSDPGKVRAREYALAVNGFEIAGGTVRIHTRDLQEKILRLLGLDAAIAMAQFGHLLEALDSGAPPHSGMALAIDATVRLLANESNIREIIAFPKTGAGTDLLIGAPSEINPSKLAEYNIQISLSPQRD